MKFSVEIQDKPSFVLNSWMASEYNQSGVYFDKNTNLYIFVSKESNLSYTISAKDWHQLFKEEKQVVREPTSIDDILRVIAVTQKPELIMERI